MICKSIYILKFYSILHALRSNPNAKKFPWNKIKVRKNAIFFLLRASTHHSFIFNSRFLNTRFVSLKACGIFHFRLRFVFIKVYFFVKKKNIESLTLKRNSKNSKWLTWTYSFITNKITRSLNILVRKTSNVIFFLYHIYSAFF